MAMVGEPIERRHRMEQRTEEWTLREGWFTRGSLLYLYVLTVTLLGVGLGIWVGLKCNALLPCVVTGIILRQILMVVGIRILFGHKEEVR